MNTPLTNLPVGDQIMSLPAAFICPYITESMPFWTPVAILLRVIFKMAFAEGTFLLVQRLSLRGNHHLDSLSIDLLKLLRVGITRICACHLAGLP
jgi:hypothetical protein